MGVAGTILAAKAISGVDVDRVLEAFDFGPPEPVDDGWFISEAHRAIDRATDYVEELIDALGGPTFIVKVFPDDWALLIAAVPGSEPMVAVLTPETVRAEVGDRPEPRAPVSRILTRVHAVHPGVPAMNRSASIITNTAPSGGDPSPD